jgi:hypothetical protein
MAGGGGYDPSRCGRLAYRAARALPDGRLAVAVESGGRVFVGVLGLSRFDIEFLHYYGFYSGGAAAGVRMDHFADDFVELSLDEYDEATWHRRVVLALGGE